LKRITSRAGCTPVTVKGPGAIRGPFLFEPERYGRTCRGIAHLPSQSNCQWAKSSSRCATPRSTSPSCRKPSTTLAEWQAAMEALMWVVVRADSRDASVKPASRCTTRHARITIGDAANWCGIDDSDDARASLEQHAGKSRTGEAQDVAILFRPLRLPLGHLSNYASKGARSSRETRGCSRPRKFTRLRITVFKSPKL
jgi:hypothetical protein